VPAAKSLGSDTLADVSGSAKYDELHETIPVRAVSALLKRKKRCAMPAQRFYR
jgi:hypothetical protein